MNRYSFFALTGAVLLGTVASLLAQPAAQSPTPTVRRDTSTAQGGWVRREIVNGDTFYVASLRMVRIQGPRTYKDAMEREMLRRYRRYAAHVYPYAVQAVDLYNTVEDESSDMSRRQRRRYLRQQKEAFKDDFEDQLKKLYKTEGYILIKMIERQTGKPCYDIIKETRGTVTAAYWHNLAKLWGYDLKDGYQVGKDPLLDEVLLDYDFGEAIWKY
jgi:hypothetical protein